MKILLAIALFVVVANAAPYPTLFESTFDQVSKACNDAMKDVVMGCAMEAFQKWNHETNKDRVNCCASWEIVDCFMPTMKRESQCTQQDVDLVNSELAKATASCSNEFPKGSPKCDL